VLRPTVHCRCAAVARGRPSGHGFPRPVFHTLYEEGEMTTFSRRDFMRTAGLGAAGLYGLGTAPGLIRTAEARERLLVVQWGAQWIEATQAIVEDYNKEYDDRIAFELHSGGAFAVVAKIKASWPRTQYNVISAWDPVFHAMIAEDWLEPVTVEDVPNIADIPEPYFAKDPAGRKMTVPLSTAGAFWGYRTDMVDKPVESVEQFLEPRFRNKLAVPYPVNLTGLLMVSLAIQNGGDERNVEPGWDLLKEIARRGNIGRICNNNSEFINAMASGEMAGGFWNNGGWYATVERFPVKIMNRLSDNKGFLYNEGFAILKGSPMEASYRFANYFAQPEVNEFYNMRLGSGPTKPGAQANPLLADMYYAPDELDTYAVFPDFPYLQTQVDGWAQRWETEVLPLIRGA